MIKTAQGLRFLTEDRWQQQHKRGLEVTEARVADVALLRSAAQPHSKLAWQGTTAPHRSSKQRSGIFTRTRLPSEFVSFTPALKFSITAMMLGEDLTTVHLPLKPS